MKVICHNCGNEVEDQNFCPKCGTKIDPKKSRRLLITGGIVFSLLIIVLGIAAYTKYYLPKKEIKDYLVETYNLSRKDIKIIHLAGAPNKVGETILTLDGGPVIITHIVKYKDFEFKVYDIDPNSGMHTFIDTYGRSVKYLDHINNLKKQIEDKLKSENVNGFIFASTDEFYNNKLTRDYDKYDLLRFNIFLEGVNDSKRNELNESIFKIIRDYTEKETLRYYYQIIILDSKESLDKIKEVDLEKYNKACNDKEMCLVDYELLIDKELNKQIVDYNEDQDGQRIYYALNDGSVHYRNSQVRPFTFDIVIDK